MTKISDKIRPSQNKRSFIRQLKPNATMLDVGCGNNSPQLAKSVRPDIYYVGLDIGDYNQTDMSRSAADEYHLTTPAAFDTGIRKCGEERFDAVISAHNLEHCLDPEATLSAMCAALKPSGQLYLAFPCEASVNFPSRQNTLNFFDDATHVAVPNWKKVLKQLDQSGMNIEFKAQRYRPLISALIGAVFEPLVAPFGKQAPKAGTWALYGFESVIWAAKRG